MSIEMVVVLFKIILIILASVQGDSLSVTDIDSKIIGGAVTSITRNPHSVFLILNGNRMCGSSIIRDRVLLSAAHCFHEIPRSALVKAYVGSEDPKKAQQVIAANKWIVHNKFSMDTLKYDIALIRLRSRIKLGGKAKKILLPSIEPKHSDVGYVAGWGNTKVDGGGGGKVLKIVKQIVRKKSDCVKIFGSMDKHQFCAGFFNPANVPYSGDSGSALLLNGNTQIGIVSCGRHWISGYVIYTSTVYFKTWIIKNTNELMKTKCSVDSRRI